MSDKFADMLPPLSTEEFAALKADIDAGKIRDPIIVDEDGNILDGRHRYKIDKDAPRKVVSGLTEAEKEAFVFRCNFVRRNLSPSQKKDVMRRMRKTAGKLRDEDAKKWTQAAVAAALGIDQTTVSLWEVKTTSNTKSRKACKPAPDARVKVNKAAKAEIVERIAAGESQAQVAADYGISQQSVSGIVTKAEKKEEEANERRKIIEEIGDLGVDGFFLGDFRDVAKTIPDNTVDLIFTDPPYDRKTLPLYADLGEIAKAKLVQGGSLICYLGQYQIHEVLNHVTPHLRLWWTLAVIHTGDSARMREYGVVVKWKPLLWFVKGTRGDKETFVDDAVDSTQEKTDHPWQQSVIEASYYIGKLTEKGGLVFDPFCGGGTTAIACKELGRKFITCDTDEGTLTIAKGRIVSK